MFEFEDKVDHVFTHWRSVKFVNKSPSFKPRVFGLHLLHDLLPEAADLGGALDGHVLGALVAGKRFQCKKTKYFYFSSNLRRIDFSQLLGFSSI